MGKIKSVEYDSIRDSVIAGMKEGFLLYATKNHPSDTPLVNCKVIYLDKDFTINFIKIVPSLKIVFFGTLCGTLAWCPYPLRIKRSMHSHEESTEITYEFL